MLVAETLLIYVHRAIASIQLTSHATNSVYAGALHLLPAFRTTTLECRVILEFRKAWYDD